MHFGFIIEADGKFVFKAVRIKFQVRCASAVNQRVGYVGCKCNFEAGHLNKD